MGFDYFKEPRSVFAVREGERSMKDTVHPAVHRSVHFCGERKLCGALRLRFTRRLILDTGKTPEWAGATPLRCHGTRGGRSSPTRILDEEEFRSAMHGCTESSMTACIAGPQEGEEKKCQF